MALTPEDVVNKRFQHVKFRDGYDQDEVDDFLDEVVVELRRLYQENDELKQKLSAAESRVGEAASGAPAAPQASEDPQATQAMPAAVPAESAEAPAWGEAPAEPVAPVVAPQEPQPAVEEAPAVPAQSPTDAAQAPTASAQSTDSAALAAAPSGADSHGLIALAQRVHDEHVSEGERKRDELIAEAETRATSIVGDAEKKRDDTLTNLETQKSDLQRVDLPLQNFERQYRTRLKSYLTDQLRDLENSGSLAPETLGDGAARRSI